MYGSKIHNCPGPYCFDLCGPLFWQVHQICLKCKLQLTFHIPTKVQSHFALSSMFVNAWDFARDAVWFSFRAIPFEILRGVEWKISRTPPSHIFIFSPTPHIFYYVFHGVPWQKECAKRSLNYVTL